MPYRYTQQTFCPGRLDKTVSNHKQMPKKGIRVTYICLFGEILVVIILTIRYLTGTLEPLGIWAAIPMGAIAGIFFFVIWFRLAKKGISIPPTQYATKKFRATFLTTVIIFGILAGIVLALIAERLPAINVINLLVTVLLVSLAVFFAIGIAGLYWLEHHYGKKLYIAGRN